MEALKQLRNLPLPDKGEFVSLNAYVQQREVLLLQIELALKNGSQSSLVDAYRKKVVELTAELQNLKAADSRANGGVGSKCDAQVYRQLLATGIMDHVFDQHKQMLRRDLEEARSKLTSMRSASTHSQRGSTSSNFVHWVTALCDTLLDSCLRRTEVVMETLLAAIPPTPKSVATLRSEATPKLRDSTTIDHVHDRTVDGHRKLTARRVTAVPAMACPIDLVTVPDMVFVPRRSCVNV